MSLKLTILSPERKLLESLPVDEITLVGSEGQIEILPGHAAMIGTLETGIFSYRASEGREAKGMISSGFFEVRDDVVVVMAETLELQGEIDVERAKRAQKAAEEALGDADLDEQRFRKYQLKLQRALIRQQLGG
ncbi:MAG TPA: ATP synthase F1 subunit epsilon [Bdellovibrionota bacterium]|nr:ATP synthase F1 subunit epsilon [Bdellovibrionota bacterium]